MRHFSEALGLGPRSVKLRHREFLFIRIFLPGESSVLLKMLILAFLLCQAQLVKFPFFCYHTKYMRDQVIELLQKVLGEMDIADISSFGLAQDKPLVTRPEDASHGDYATNVAMILAKSFVRQLTDQDKKPMEIAKEIQERIIKHQKASELPWLDRVEVASPGFINFFLSEASVINQLGQVLMEKDRFGMASAPVVTERKSDETPLKTRDKRGDGELASMNKGKTSLKISQNFRVTPASGEIAEKKIDRQDKAKRVMIEFSHPNTHKAFHIGHLRNITIGESIVRLLEAVGYEVIRANYQGDVGMHIAKALYALLYIPEHSSKVEHISLLSSEARMSVLGQAYAAGSKAYEEDEEAKKKIGEINKMIYAKDAEVYSLYQRTRKWSLDYFEAIYQRIGSHFDRYYFEGEVYESGKKIVLDGLKKRIFQESEGAIIFPGEKFGLHNRVFITSEGNTTYEGKEMGLASLEFGEYEPDLIIHVVGPEQAGYFQVVFEAIAQLYPQMRGKEYHLIYGWVKLKHGKMSSRSGNVVLGEWLLDEAKKEVYKILDQSIKKYSKEEQEIIAEKAAVAAVKYAFLKVSLKSEIAFDFAESVNLHGDSGPYLQYTYARCKSVLRKTGHIRRIRQIGLIRPMNAEENALARALAYFPEIVADAAKNFAPNTLCTYLFQLAQAFNLLYAKHEILKNDLRLTLTAATAQILKNGLYLLGIEVLEQM